MAPSRGLTPRTLVNTLASHAGPVHVARYSQGTATYVLTGGQDRSVRLWNANAGNEIKAYKAHGYEVLSISVAHDNAKFASSGGDRSVFIWDISTGNTIRRIPGHIGKINAVEFNYDASVIASGSYDATVKLWDLRAQTRQAIQSLDEARDAIQTLYIGGTYIVTGSVDGYVRMYDLRKGELRSDYLGSPVTSVLPTKDGTTVLCMTLDGHVRLMDIAFGKLLNDFEGHSHSGYRCRACFGANEAIVLAGDESGEVWAWDLVDAKPLLPSPPPKVHDKVVLWVEHHPSQSEMITAGGDGVVKVWRSSDSR